MTAPDFTVDAEGVSIGVFADDSDGIPLVMVHGSIADHTTFDALVEALVPTFATYRMDRRGFGASGDGSDYSIEHEFADVAAVLEEVSARSGGPVAVFGHSYGANCALGAAALSGEISHLVLYEPSLGLRTPMAASSRSRKPSIAKTVTPQLLRCSRRFWGCRRTRSMRTVRARCGPIG